METEDWSKYGLTDNPFLLTPKINIRSTDGRLNGRFFCEDVAKTELDKVIHSVTRGANITYVNSGSESVLGWGKSALMAATYWRLKDENFTVIWVEAMGGAAIQSTLARIVDCMVAEGVIDDIKAKLGDISPDRIAQLLEPTTAIGPAFAAALVRILSPAKEEIAQKFVNIRRSLSVMTPNDLFGYILALMHQCGFKRIVIFIDQFEDYIRIHTGAALKKLGIEVNQLIRAIENRANFVVTLHPDAEKLYMSATGGYIGNLAPINAQTQVVMQPLTPEYSIRFVQFYLSKFRTDPSNKTVFPFSEDLIRYISLALKGNPRDLITASHRALAEGAKRGYVKLDEEFISDESAHSEVLPGLPNEWEKFKEGKLE